MLSQKMHFFVKNKWIPYCFPVLPFPIKPQLIPKPYELNWKILKDAKHFPQIKTLSLRVIISISTPPTARRKVFIFLAIIKRFVCWGWLSMVSEPRLRRTLQGCPSSGNWKRKIRKKLANWLDGLALLLGLLGQSSVNYGPWKAAFCKPA